MSHSPDDELRIFQTSPNFQLKLSQLLSSPPSSLAFPSGLAMLSIKQGCFAEILFCDEKFTAIENSIVVEGVGALADIRIQYQAREKSITMVYRKGNVIHFYEGKIPVDRDSMRRSTVVTSKSASAPFNQVSAILSISSIVSTRDAGTYCLIGMASGKTYLLRFVGNKLTIEDTNPPSRLGRFFTAIAKPLFRNDPLYSRCKLYLHPQSDPESLYTLSLFNKQLKMRFFNLASQNPHQELNSWQVDLEDRLPTGSQVLHSIFKPENHNQDNFGVELILVCCLEGHIDLIILSIDLNTQIKHSQSIENIFNLRSPKTLNPNPRIEQQQSQSQSEQPMITFDMETDYLEVEELDGKIYVIYHRKLEGTSQINNKRYMLATVWKGQGKLKVSTPKMVNIGGELRLAKMPTLDLQDMNEDQGSLLLIGQSYCYSFHKPQPLDYPNHDQRSPQNLFASHSERSRRIPPVPSFDEGPRMSLNSERKQLVASRSLRQSRANSLNEGDFDGKKIQKYIFSKNYTMLFGLLNLERNRFNQEMEQKTVRQICENDPERVVKQLKALVLLKLFTLQEGLNLVLNDQLIKHIFNEKILRKHKERGDEQFHTFLSQLFVNKNEQLLTEVFHELFANKEYRAIYNACIQTVGNFVGLVLGRLGDQGQGQGEGKEKGEMIDQREEGMLVELLKQNFADSYLRVYQQLLNTLLSNYLQLQTIPPHQPGTTLPPPPIPPTTPSFTPYHTKQLLQQYLQLKHLTSPSHSRPQTRINNEQMLSIVKLFLSRFPKMGRFLVAMAIEFGDLALFDFGVRARLVARGDLGMFVGGTGARVDRGDVEMLLINMVKAEIEHLARNRNNKNLSLYILSWIPDSYKDTIFTYLMQNYPKIGLAYGLSTKPRKQLAAYLLSNPHLLSSIKQSSTLLHLLQPLYTLNLPGLTPLKINIDLARLFSSVNKSFISYEKMMEMARGKNAGLTRVEIKRENWDGFQGSLRGYLDQGAIQEIKGRFIVL